MTLSKRATGAVVGIATGLTLVFGAVAPSAANAAPAASSDNCRYVVVPGGTVVKKQCGGEMPPKLQACLFSIGGSALVAAATGGALTPAVYGALIGCGAMGVEWINELENKNTGP